MVTMTHRNGSPAIQQTKDHLVPLLKGVTRWGMKLGKQMAMPLSGLIKVSPVEKNPISPPS